MENNQQNQLSPPPAGIHPEVWQEHQAKVLRENAALIDGVDRRLADARAAMNRPPTAAEMLIMQHRSQNMAQVQSGAYGMNPYSGPNSRGGFNLRG